MAESTNDEGTSSPRVDHALKEAGSVVQRVMGEEIREELSDLTELVATWRQKIQARAEGGKSE